MSAGGAFLWGLLEKSPHTPKNFEKPAGFTCGRFLLLASASPCGLRTVLALRAVSKEASPAFGEAAGSYKNAFGVLMRFLQRNRRFLGVLIRSKRKAADGWQLSYLCVIVFGQGQRVCRHACALHSRPQVKPAGFSKFLGAWGILSRSPHNHLPLAGAACGPFKVFGGVGTFFKKSPQKSS